MPIQFNRNQANALWQKPMGNTPSPLKAAFADHQLNRAEYNALKTAFLKEQPDGNFDTWLADALDGNLDQKIAPELRSGLEALSRKGSATESISFALNEQGNGYETQAVAQTYTNNQWLESAKQADSNKDGRLDTAEAKKATGLPEHLRQGLDQGRAVLTYNDEQQSISYYPALESPELNARYKDLKLTLDVDLKDIDGLGDVSRKDIQGTTSGSLNFDWNGPLIDGIKQAVEEQSGGWVKAQANFTTDKNQGGPGYQIYAHSGRIATRPIVIKSNTAGELYIESPGFGSSIRIALGEKGLKKYALPKLKAMGLDLHIEKRDGRIYLKPQRLDVKNVPLAATQGGNGELNIDLAKNTRFEATKEGLKATFTEAKVTGSSGSDKPLAIADAAPDTVKGRIEAGLNYDVKKSQLDTQVVLKNTVAELSLDATEMQNQLYLPRNIAEKAGDHLRAKLTLEGSYRTINGTEHKGSVHGFIEVDNEDSNNPIKGYGRFKTGIGEKNLAVSALGITLDKNLKAQAQQGSISFSKTPKIDLYTVSGRAEASEGERGSTLLTQAKALLDGPQPIALQFRSLLTHAGLDADQLQTLAQGRDEELTHLLSSKTWLDRLEKTVISLESQHLQLQQTGDNLVVAGESLTLNATGSQKPDEKGKVKSTANAKAQAGSFKVELGKQEQRIETRNTRASVTMNIQGDTPETAGTVKARATLETPETYISLSKNEAAQQKVKLSIKDSKAHGEIQAKSISGPEIRLAGDASNMGLTMTKTDLSIKAETLEGSSEYISEGGSQAKLTAESRNVHLQQNVKGEWQLQVPDAKAKLAIGIDLKELQSLMKGFSLDGLAEFPTSASQQDMQKHLTQAGMNEKQAKQTASLLWKPELRQLLQNSDFFQALKDSKNLAITTEFEGNLGITSNRKEGFGATGQSKVEVSAKLSRDASHQNNTIIDARAKANVALKSDNKSTQLTTPELNIEAQAYRKTGTQFGELEARLSELKSQISSTEQSIESGKITGKLEFSSTLDTAKIEQIQTLLHDFRNDLLTRLDALGINRQQLENVLQAFGKNQLEALFKALKPEDVSALSSDLGLSENQIKELTHLLSQEPFQKLVQNLFDYSDLLTDANANVKLNIESEQGLWSRNDHELLTQLKTVQASINASSETSKGTGSLNTEWQQENITYNQQNQDAQLEWGKQQVEIKGTLHRNPSAESSSEHFEATGNIQNHGGKLSRQKGDMQTRIAETEIIANIKQEQKDGSKGSLDFNTHFSGIQTEQESTGIKINNFKASAQGHIKDNHHKAEITGKGEIKSEQMQVEPETFAMKSTTLSGEIESQYTFPETKGKADTALGKAEIELSIPTLSSGKTEGVRVPSAQFKGSLNTHLTENNAPHASMSFSAQNGQLNELRAKSGNVSFEHLEAQMNQKLNAPMARGDVSGNISVEQYRSEDKIQHAKSFKVDQIAGKVYVKTEHLRTLLERSTDAQNVLETLSKRWANSSEAPDLFTNDEITLDISEGQWQGDNTDGNAMNPGQNLQAKINLPDLETRLGSSKVQIELNNLSLNGDNKAEIELTGTAQFSPHQPEFNQSVQSLLDRSLKNAGLNLKPEVSFVNGKFEVKIDRWYVDGLVNIDFNKDNIQVSIDEAKLLRFISTKKLATRLSESQINNYLLDVERKDNVINLSLNEFSASILHKDNLQIQSITTEDNRIDARFAYTDTQTYNKGYQERQQNKIEDRLFKNAVTGRTRSQNELEDRVEDLNPTTLKQILKAGSAEQLDRMLIAVGGNADNIVRKALDSGSEISEYTVANRAILAAHLSRSRGLFERVSSEEKMLINKLVNSLSTEEKKVFEQTLTREAMARIEKVRR